MVDIDYASKKLGKLPAKTEGIPHAHAYMLTSVLDSPPPASVDWSKFVTVWGDMKNETYGDCGPAGYAHLMQASTAAARTEWTASDAQVLGLYSAVTGFDPRKPSTDQGTVLSELLLYVLKHGFCGRGMVAYAAVNPKNQSVVKHAIAMFGGLYVGMSLPVAAQDEVVWGEFDTIEEKNEDQTAGSWGGHCIFVTGYNIEHVEFVSWGKKMAMTWDFFLNYCDEAYGVLTAAFIKDGHAPNGLAVADLVEAANKLRLN